MEKRGKKISLHEILEEVDLKDVKAFLSNYAKNDKSFDVAIKAHFISRIITGDPDGKYLKILNQIIKPRTLSNDKVGPTLKKTIKIIFQDFLFQMDDLLSTENYVEAFYIIKNSLDKIAYLQNKYLITDKAIENFRIGFLDNLEVILAQNLAPKFRKKAETLLIENISKSYYFPDHKNLIVLLDDFSVLTETDKKKVVADLLKKISKNYDNQNLIRTLLQIAAPIPSVAKILLSEIPHNKIFLCLVDMVRERKFEVVEFYISEKSLDYNLHSNVISAMILHSREKYSKLITTLNHINPSTTPILIIRELIQSFSAHFLYSEFTNLKKWISELPFGLRCELLFMAEKFDLLVTELSEKEDLEWIKVYDKNLIKAGYEEKVEKIYSELAVSYLDEHLGETANLFILKILHRLKSLSQIEMLERLQMKLYEKYSHRKSLQKI